MGYRNTARRITARNTLLAGALLLLAGTSSCAQVPDPPSSSSATSRPWSGYTTADGSLRFEHPQDWKVTELPALANDPAGGISVEVAEGSGRVVARLDTGIIADLSCTAPAGAASYTEYESVPMPELDSAQGSEQRFVYRSLAPSGTRSAQATYAVVSGRQDGNCGLFDFFTLTETSGGRFAGEYPAADAQGDAQSYLDGAARYPDTQEYRDLRRMLTSLRNAG
ncbi:hypothetical protein [Arthrobacter sp. YD2]|uniref:hypothetical protein n=1 Tax=Arthrobacter sp. YD2 TaxID=3058046 RepID=UPI0025B41D13|nr:hypothetical protein [Arthrobacter sp. YD2]MDN3905399.1 hypothetical protein [Arthrobacter sp. YD2]